uniref:Uncharacterized protein n=1 Tax=Podarcis muralis TaxID=64176 RepID=A0A670JZM3_PODMU
MALAEGNAVAASAPADEESEPPPPPPAAPGAAAAAATSSGAARPARLPLARVKALVKADPDVSLASQEAIFILARAAEWKGWWAGLRHFCLRRLAASSNHVAKRGWGSANIFLMLVLLYTWPGNSLLHDP